MVSPFVSLSSNKQEKKDYYYIIIKIILQMKVRRRREKTQLLQNQALCSKAHLSGGDQGPPSKDLGALCLCPLCEIACPFCLVLFMALSKAYHFCRSL